MFRRIIPPAMRRYVRSLEGLTHRRESPETAPVGNVLTSADLRIDAVHLGNPPNGPAPPAPSTDDSGVDDYRTYRMERGGPDPFVIGSRPAESYPFAYVTVTRGGQSATELLFTSHLCLSRLLIEYDFETVLDIGAGQGSATRLFRHAGKQVTAIDILEGMGADYVGNYLDMDFAGRQWDVIWCSHVLEHIRNVGAFLDKVWDDLRVGGILALTVPNQAYHSLILGHCNLFNTGLLLYDLVCAGFDCRQAVAKCYDYNLSVIVRKSPNGIERSSFASVPFDSPAGGKAEGHLQDVCRYFPYHCTDYMPSEVDSVGWDACSRKLRI